MKKDFWREFISDNNEVVDSATVLRTLALVGVGLVLAGPVAVFSLIAAYHHIWTLGKGLDGPVVNLLIALLTAATGGLGGAMLSRFGGGTGIMGNIAGPVSRAKPAPTPPEK